MGLLTSLKEVALNAIQVIKSSVSINPTTAAFASHPKTTAAILGVGAAVVAAPTAVATAVAAIPKVAKSLIPTSTKGKVLAGAIAIPAAQTLLTSSTAREKAVSLASGYSTLGTDIGKAIEGKTGVLDLLKSHPVAAAATAVAGALTIGKAVPAVAALAIGKSLGSSNVNVTPSGLLVDSRAPETLKEAGLTGGTTMTMAKASPTSPITTPPVTTPAAIPVNKAPSTTKPKKKKMRKTQGVTGRLRQTINLRWN